MRIRLQSRRTLLPTIAASAAATMVPASVQARTAGVMVPFEWNSAELSPLMHERIAMTVARMGTTDPWGTLDRMEIEGHDDASVTAEHSLRLSLRRAEAVLSHVLRLGVPAEKIILHAYGASRQLVPTDNGVREPHNCYVYISLH